jgi:alpha-L-rhamnosidase
MHSFTLLLVTLVSFFTFTLSIAITTPTSTYLQPQDIRIANLRLDTHEDLVIQTQFPTFSWQLMSEIDSLTQLPIRSVEQIAYQITIREVSTTNNNANANVLLWDSGRVESSQSTHIKYNGQQRFKSDTRYQFTLQYWSSTGAVSKMFQGNFRTALFDAQDWQGSWIGSQLINMNEVRKTFNIPSSISSATVFISGIGYYELYVNGQNVDPTRKLDVGWTTYEKRTLYSSFDLTKLLVGSQDNAIGILLGDGWYSQEQYYSGQHEPYGPPRAIMQLNIVLQDGSNMSIVTDKSWVGREGALKAAGVYRGEIYDSRLERPGWAQVDFNDPTMGYWIPVEILPSPLDSDGILSLQMMDPIRKGTAALHIATSAGRTGHDGKIEGVAGASITQGELQPVATFSPAGVPVYDFGQNFAGICNYQFNYPRGMSVFMRYGESLSRPYGDDNGNYHAYNFLYTDNLRNAVANDIYIANGTGTQTYESKFTYHGFRYIQVVGSGGPDAKDITCYPLHSETTLVGNFTSTNQIINQIQHNVQWGQLSNVMGLITDCSQRDERKGWMGDASLTVDEAFFNFDLEPFYENFLNLIRDVQGSDGAVGDTTPLTFGSAPADPSWGTAYPTIVYFIQDHYGNTGVVEEFIDSLIAFIDEEIGQYNQTGLANMFYHYGDWVPPMPYTATNQSLTSAFSFMRDVTRIAQMATMANRPADAARLNALYTQLTAEFHKTWYVPSQNGYCDNKQAANIFALASPGVVPDNLKAGVVATLVNDINTKGQLTTGISSTACLFTVLSDNGHHDLSLKLLSQTSYPSYGWTFNNEYENATTLWELWQGPMDDNAGGGGMNSRNHHMFGAVGAYFYRELAGIHLNGLQTIDIAPRMAITTEGAMLLPYVTAEVQTIKGGVFVDWSRDDARFDFNEDSDDATLSVSVTIPPNTNARVHFEPLRTDSHCTLLTEGTETVLFKEGMNIMEANSLLENGNGITLLEETATGKVIAHVQSGSYTFNVRWSKVTRDLKKVY